MQSDHLTDEEKKTLLRLARQAMEGAVKKGKPPRLDPSTLTLRLKEQGASFVTLTIRGQLRGCIRSLQSYQPLAEDVCEHAIAAALEDARFPPVDSKELNQINIEVSRLTEPYPLEYSTADDLIQKLRPNMDGVILSDGIRRATFLPQVWEKIPDPARFLENLCYKMGRDPDAWRRKHLDVMIYQVEEFRE